MFVYVKDGLGTYSFDAPTETRTIDQKDCRYHPHVFGVRVGQPVEIMNSDPTLHNIHALPKDNAEFNNGQPIQGMKMTHTFTAKEVMVPFKCDVHGWMNAYVGVVDHPFFAVTDKDGKFVLKGLPPGTYTIEAWHEKLGVQTAHGDAGREGDEGRELLVQGRPPRLTRQRTGGAGLGSGRAGRMVSWPDRTWPRLDPSARPRPPQPLPVSCMLHRFATFVAGCTVLLVLAGSLVTSTDSGLSVPDWPTTYGWNMFTFPPSKWVGGIFYEHGHRLIASTVGFLTIVLAAWLAMRGAAPVDEVAGRRPRSAPSSPRACSAA